jgi:hypothetical protein
MEISQATRITVTVNAAYHATGRRVGDLPITPAKLLSPSVERSYSAQRREE